VTDTGLTPQRDDDVCSPRPQLLPDANCYGSLGRPPRESPLTFTGTVSDPAATNDNVTLAWEVAKYESVETVAIPEVGVELRH
jgi:hypothetical protein